MKIHALCLVKNENDIIEQTLRAAAEWCDGIYVLDNGSTDGTWEKVNDLSQVLHMVIPDCQDTTLFTDSIRDNVLQRYLPRAKPGDWWCVLDADELYIDDPRQFLRVVPAGCNSVWAQLYTYLFTEKDLALYQRGSARYDSGMPIQRKLRYYVVSRYSPLRFFRHTAGLRHISAEVLHPIFPQRIRLKHFAYRSPEQIQRRLDTRREPMQRGEFLHEKRAGWISNGVIVPGPAQQDDFPRSWAERVVHSSGCHYDAGDGAYAEPHPWTPPEPPKPIEKN